MCSTGTHLLYFWNIDFLGLREPPVARNVWATHSDVGDLRFGYVPCALLEPASATTFHRAAICRLQVGCSMSEAQKLELSYA